MERFNKKQAITELDVTTGTPVTEAKLIEQGQYYYEVNQIIHRHAAQLFSVTVWGLIDGLSWRSGEALRCCSTTTWRRSRRTSATSVIAPTFPSR